MPPRACCKPKTTFKHIVDGRPINQCPAFWREVKQLNEQNREWSRIAPQLATLTQPLDL